MNITNTTNFHDEDDLPGEEDGLNCNAFGTWEKRNTTPSSRLCHGGRYEGTDYDPCPGKSSCYRTWRDAQHTEEATVSAESVHRSAQRTRTRLDMRKLMAKAQRLEDAQEAKEDRELEAMRVERDAELAELEGMSYRERVQRANKTADEYFAMVAGDKKVTADWRFKVVEDAFNFVESQLFGTEGEPGVTINDLKRRVQARKEDAMRRCRGNTGTPDEDTRERRNRFLDSLNNPPKPKPKPASKPSPKFSFETEPSESQTVADFMRKRLERVKYTTRSGASEPLTPVFLPREGASLVDKMWRLLGNVIQACVAALSQQVLEFFRSINLFPEWG